ncbi:MAG: DNA polymerase IV [Desulfurella sp.]|uniref:DNA polymerase IV n=1 Tax=Desulfurella sp. TaxID=1962857 RepID=UPI000CA9557C|nr:DNA polymerase IV [Desulfurella sp.]PMP88437.1 MAG: DNA polymerase IV [Desulfurella sp.]
MLQENTGKVICTHTWSSAIAHIDADAFFVACEQALNPSLKGKCVAVGKERGIITALSYEAKQKGIKRGMRLNQAKNICRDLIVLESHYETYSLFSVRMFEILKRFSPLIEEYSIDEAFVDLTGLRRLHSKTYKEIALSIQSTIKQELNISVSIGVSLTKTLAKLASKLKKPYGITLIPGNQIHLFLKDTPIEDVWGIGPNTASLLKKLNIRTALEFVEKDENFLKRYLSKPYIQTYNELKGIQSIEFIPKLPNKSISKAQSFAPSNKESFIFSELVKNLELASYKTRRHGLFAKKLTVFLKTSDFQVSFIKVALSIPTNLPIMLTNTLKEAFNKIYTQGLFYRQTGIVLSDLTEKTQQDLFEDTVKIEKIERIYKALDKINSRFGNNTVCLASSLASKQNKKQHLNLPFIDIKI